MRQYKVFCDPSGEYELVKCGWAWPAFFFGFIWAFVKQMWMMSLVLFAISLSLTTIVNPDSFNIIGLMVGIFMGVKGNDFVCENLLSRGYKFTRTVTACNKDFALVQLSEMNGAPAG